MNRLLLTAALIAGGVHPAFAMNVRESRKQLARAPDGSTLHEVRSAGPEGGGSLAYRLQGKAPGDRIDCVVSSDFNPGDGSRPQVVTPQLCAQRLDQLARELAKRKFSGVAVHAEACKAKDRSGAVVTKVSPAAR
jgi:hypothetical protein